MTNKEMTANNPEQYFDLQNDRRLGELMSLLAEKKRGPARSDDNTGQQADELELSIRGYDLVLSENAADDVWKSVRERIPVFAQIAVTMQESAYTNKYQAVLDEIIDELRSGNVPKEGVIRKHYALVALTDQLVKNDVVFQARLRAFFAKQRTSSPNLDFLLSILKKIGYNMSLIEAIADN